MKALLSILPILLLMTIILGCSTTTGSQNEESNTALLTSEPVIMAYYVAERNYQPEEIPVEKLTHIIYSFTNVIDGR